MFEGKRIDLNRKYPRENMVQTLSPLFISSNVQSQYPFDILCPPDFVQTQQ